MGRIGGALAQLLQGRSIAVGGDFRTHTPQLKRALIEALLRGGAEVWDVGQLSTPQLYFSKRALGTWACAQVTASHNPPQYNGLKLMAEPRKAPVQGDQPTANTSPKTIAEKKPVGLTFVSGLSVRLRKPIFSTPA